MKTVRLEDFKEDVSKWVDKVRTGEVVVITEENHLPVKLEVIERGEEAGDEIWNPEDRISTRLEDLPRIDSTYGEEDS